MGDRVLCADWQFEVTVLDGKRIDKVRACRVAIAPSADSASDAVGR
jgi:CBS domain containing-hemolysin-like protein